MPDLPSALERVKAAADVPRYPAMNSARDDQSVVRTADLRAIVAALDALNWWATQTGVSVDCHYDGEPDDPSEWRAMRAHGGWNDREWTVIGRGATPLEALSAAFLAKMGGAKS